MGIGNLDDFDFGHLCPIKATRYFLRDWIVSRDKNQPIRMIEIHAELPLAVTCQFVAPRWGNAGDVAEIFGGV